MKKIVAVLLALTAFLYAKEAVPKVGCILAQDGKVSLHYQDKNKKSNVFNNVKYTAVKKEGINFKEIFVGSSIKAGFEDKLIKLTILDIKANPRVKPNPRTGTMKVNVRTNETNKEISMNYVYDENIMKVKGIANITGFEMINFETKIKAVLCKI